MAMRIESNSRIPLFHWIERLATAMLQLGRKEKD
jgi:hypothetical protein